MTRCNVSYLFSIFFASYIRYFFANGILLSTSVIRKLIKNTTHAITGTDITAGNATVVKPIFLHPTFTKS